MLLGETMKEKIHPKYRKVLFVDSSTNFKCVCGSALESQETEVFEGVEYPVVRVATSSSSHPYFVGGKKYVDAEGRVDKFTKKYQVAAKKAQEAKLEAESAEAKAKASKAKRKR